MHTDEQVLEVLLDQFRVSKEQVAAARENHPGAPVLEALLEDGAVREIRHLPNSFAMERPFRYG